MKPILAFTVTVLSAALCLVAACADDPDARPPSEADAPDTQSSVPEAGPPADARPTPEEKDPYTFADEEVVCASAAGACAKQIVAGEAHFCARMADGTVRCWGDDEFGNLGRAPDPGEPSDGGPAIEPVQALASVTQISAANDTTCARLEEGGVRCWGANASAELGLSPEPSSDYDRHPVPTAPVGVDGVERVDVGHGNVCAVLASGKIWCWGMNDHYQLGREEPSWYAGPAAAGLDPVGVQRVQGGTNSMLGITGDGDLWVWGALSGDSGYCSGVISALSMTASPRKIASLSKVTSFGISAHVRPESRPPLWRTLPEQAHACALVHGEVYCWGRSDKAALCTGLPDRELEPRHAPIEGKAWPQRLAVGHEITCVRMTDGTVQCCGGNEGGRLGLPVETPFSARFGRVPTFTKHAVEVAASHGAVCALAKDGTVECWGSNTKGELGTAFGDEDAHPETHVIPF